jgi:hypothetical protein
MPNKHQTKTIINTNIVDNPQPTIGDITCGTNYKQLIIDKDSKKRDIFVSALLDDIMSGKKFDENEFISVLNTLL